MSRKYTLVEEEIELSRESTYDSQDTHCNEDEDGASASLLPSRPQTAQSWARYLTPLTYLLPRRIRKSYSPRKSRRTHIVSHRTWSPRSIIRKFLLLLYVFFAAITGLVIIGGLFFPSYTHLPKHYQDLQNLAQSSLKPGRGNPGQEKVFIAASIYDEGGDLANGAWGRNILNLIDLLGPENTYLSIYENDAGLEAKNALTLLREKVPCNSTLTFEEHLPIDTVPSVTLPDGTRRVKRIAYLAEVRNRALRPLESTSIRYDKLLYLNDVVFNPVDILQLIFSTNKGESGRAEYRAACAVDFINPFKFYDTFATRDSEGYSMGVIFFPWFSPGGEAHSRQQVLNGDDAVQVRSCWGGAVSFDAKYFQSSSSELDVVTAGSQSPLNLTAPARFRAEYDPYWDASECCLIHADIQSPDPNNSGIYMNPFVRVAYGSRTLSWLKFTRRFERLYSPIQFLIDVCYGNPVFNERREEQPWQETEEIVWVPNSKSPSEGSFERVPRLGNHAGYCGRRKLSVMKEHPSPGERNWEFVPIPTSS